MEEKAIWSRSCFTFNGLKKKLDFSSQFDDFLLKFMEIVESGLKILKTK